MIFRYNKRGQLATGKTENIFTPQVLCQDSEIKSFACGGYHTLIYRENGDLFVCGVNDSGQLGLGHNYHQNELTLLLRDKSIPRGVRRR